MLLFVSSQGVRFTLPSVESYAKKVRDCKPEGSAENQRQEEEKKTSNMWRGLRLASKNRLSSFDKLEHGNGLERLFHPDPTTSTEAAVEDGPPTAPENRDALPQEQNESTEEQRPEQQSQVTTDAAAE